MSAMSAPAPAQVETVPPGPEVVLLFTRFPYPTETFLQREVRALCALGVRLRLMSLWSGTPEFDDLPVEAQEAWLGGDGCE